MTCRNSNERRHTSNLETGLNTVIQAHWRHTCFVMVCCLLAACSTTPYQPEKFDPAQLSVQALTQNNGKIQVTAAVPGREQALEIFGFDMYERGIQPVWLSIENQGNDPVRYAPTGTDPNYFPPLEVAWMFQKNFSKQARPDLEKHLYKLSVKRRIEAGATNSGFIFTNASKGRKNFIVDVFSPTGEDQSFAFFLEVPGFVPDHAVIDFKNLYKSSEMTNYEANEFRTMLSGWQCCTEDINGDINGLPLATILIGKGETTLRALLKGDWYETRWQDERAKTDLENSHYLFGRQADAVLRIKRNAKKERNELHVWKAPWLLEGENVWVVLVTHFIGQRTQLENALFGARFDPNMDDSRDFLLQNFWYSQSLSQLAWVNSHYPSTSEVPVQDFNDAHYFTNGFRVVIWLSDETISLSETKVLEWDYPYQGDSQ